MFSAHEINGYQKVRILKNIMKNPLLVLLFVSTLVGGTGNTEQATRPTGSNIPMLGLAEPGDFVSTIRRADIISNRGFDFRVTFFESTYKNYLKEPYISVFTIYIQHTQEMGATIQIAMCSATEICIHRNRGGGIFGAELYRTGISFEDGSLDFTIPSDFIPKDTEMPRNGVLMWSNMGIDGSLWRVTLSNSRNAAVVPSWPIKKFPPRYIRYRNFLEIISLQSFSRDE